GQVEDVGFVDGAQLDVPHAAAVEQIDLFLWVRRNLVGKGAESEHLSIRSPRKREFLEIVPLAGCRTRASRVGHRLDYLLGTSNNERKVSRRFPHVPRTARAWRVLQAAASGPLRDIVEIGSSASRVRLSGAFLQTGASLGTCLPRVSCRRDREDVGGTKMGSGESGRRWAGGVSISGAARYSVKRSHPSPSGAKAPGGRWARRGGPRYPGGSSHGRCQRP